MATLTKEVETQLRLIPLPQIANDEVYNENIAKASRLNLDFCLCCGKALATSKYYVHTAFGGSAYIPVDETVYDDTWVMWIGASCKSKLPKEYIFKTTHYEN